MHWLKYSVLSAARPAIGNRFFKKQGSNLFLQVGSLVEKTHIKRRTVPYGNMRVLKVVQSWDFEKHDHKKFVNINACFKEYIQILVMNCIYRNL
jgi:hypothetical protein